MPSAECISAEGCYGGSRACSGKNLSSLQLLSVAPQYSDTLSSFVSSEHWALNATSLMGSAVEWELAVQWL